jgi:hypothetical protein
MDMPVKVFQIWVHEGFYLLVAGVHPSQLPVSQTAPPTRGIVGIGLPTMRIASKASWPVGADAPPPMVATLSNIGVVTDWFSS